MKMERLLHPYTVLYSVACFIILFLFVFSSSSGAEEAVLLPNWHIFGGNTLRLDYHQTAGDTASAPYRVEGLRGYNEFNINFNNRINPYNLWRGQVSGVINDSPYRSADRGIILERFNLTKEKGDVSLPFRVELG